MKIITRVVMSMDDWEVKEEESHEYEGPVALCESDNGDRGAGGHGGGGAAGNSHGGKGQSSTGGTSSGSGKGSKGGSNGGSGKSGSDFDSAVNAKFGKPTGYSISRDGKPTGVSVDRDGNFEGGFNPSTPFEHAAYNTFGPVTGVSFTGENFAPTGGFVDRKGIFGQMSERDLEHATRIHNYDVRKAAGMGLMSNWAHRMGEWGMDNLAELGFGAVGGLMGGPFGALSGYKLGANLTGIVDPNTPESEKVKIVGSMMMPGPMSVVHSLAVDAAEKWGHKLSGPGAGVDKTGKGGEYAQGGLMSKRGVTSTPSRMPAYDPAKDPYLAMARNVSSGRAAPGFMGDYGVQDMMDRPKTIDDLVEEYKNDPYYRRAMESWA